MKAFGLFLLLLAAAGASLRIFAPEKAEAFVARAQGFVRLVPDPPPPVPAAPRAAPAAAPLPPAPPWKVLDRKAAAAYEEGSFAQAARIYEDALRLAPPNEVPALRARAGRAKIDDALAEEVAPVMDRDAARDEAEVRRRIGAITERTAGAYLSVAEYAAAHGLRHHLAYLYEMAFERKQDGTGAMSRAVAQAYRKKKVVAADTPQPDLAEAILEELPVGEAADVAAEDRGSVGGEAGREASDSADNPKLEEARKYKKLGDAEYKKAIPGSANVNVHRKAALAHYRKAQALYEELDRASGRNAYGRTITEINRDIAEIRKDLPIDK